MMRAFVVGAVLLLLALVVVTGCQKVKEPSSETPPVEQPMPTENMPGEGAKVAAPTGGGKVIGVTLLTKTHVFYQDLEKGMQEAADKLGYKLAVDSAEFTASDQEKQIDNFIVQKVAALVVCPADSASVGGPIKKANAAGIPVFTADIAAQEGEVVCHIASDNKQGGRKAGEYLAQAIGGQGQVIVIDHPAVTSVQDRVAGFEEALKKYPKIELVEKPPAEGQRSKARDVAANKLIEFPQLRGIFGINDDSALGALAACEATKGAEKIVIVGYDATPEAREKIVKGTQLKADVVQFPVKMGLTTIETIDKYLRGEKVPKQIPIEVDILDKAKLSKEAPKQ